MLHRFFDFSSTIFFSKCDSFHSIHRSDYSLLDLHHAGLEEWMWRDLFRGLYSAYYLACHRNPGDSIARARYKCDKIETQLWDIISFLQQGRPANPYTNIVNTPAG